ncbi:MAG: hypothetical protein IT289_08410 [Oligoflexia bacterium]|nr:hypothetical protein [Oligoflexia bacterium]
MKHLVRTLGIVGAFAFALACSDVKLTRPDNYIAAGQSQAIVGSLPQASVPSNERLIIILDMSNSAVRGSCPDEVDDPRFPSEETSPCGSGFDNKGDRFTWAQKWIDDFASAGLSDFKVMLVPFAGGDASYPQDQTDIQNMIFQNSAGAKAYLNILKQRHDKAAAKFNAGQGTPNDSLGTSIFLQGLDYAHTVLDAELSALGGKAHDTKFDIVVVSDGIPTPRQKDYDIILGPCLETERRLAEGTRPCTDSGDDFACRVCEPYISAVKRNLGDPMLNNPDQVWLKALGLSGLVRNRGFGVSRLTLKLTQPHPEFIDVNRNRPIEELADPRNQIAEINLLRYLANKMNLIVQQSSTDEPPFRYDGFSSGGKTYRLSDHIVVNLNGRVNAAGKLVVDSDGDGLDDISETSAGLDAKKSRTNGYCLDGITHIFGCKQLGCRPEVDTDGDGLNQCEEDVLSLDDGRFDSDGDGIPDLYEVYYSTRLLQDDRRLDDSADGISNKQAFLKGAVAQADLKVAKESSLISSELRYLGDKNGQAQYSLVIKSIPLVATTAVNDNFELFRSESLDPLTKVSDGMKLTGTAHGPAVNQIIIILKAVSIKDPEDVVYFMKRVEGQFGKSSLPPISFSTFVQMY